MELFVYNTLTRMKEEFKPLSTGRVGMYSCGPTVYNFAHIGNFRAYIFADLLKRYLLYKGFQVKHVMNLTDVDDKTIRDSQKEGMTLKAFTQKYTQYFMEDIKTLNLIPAELFPKATEHVPHMVALIKQLEKNNHTYQSEDKSTYFRIHSFKEYGKLSKLHLEGLESGAGGRVKKDEYEKENASDFALWKAYEPGDGEVYWETELGKGRPGWHIECSAMSTAYLGESFDIHTGGVDLIFPHHENEIAQTEGATNKPFVKYWMHNEHLLIDGRKMSKSLGNFFTLRDLLKQGHDPRGIRFVLASTHYRQQLNFTLEAVGASTNSVERLQNLVDTLSGISKDSTTPEVPEKITLVREKFEAAMDDDLNISEALGVLFDFVREVNSLIGKQALGWKDAEQVLAFFKDADSVLGVLSFDREPVPREIMALVQEREDVRKARDWKRSDELREEIKKQGYFVEDTPKGPVVKHNKKNTS
ncbi:cysteine--tRNA ligase [Candidatus Woesearchaeota archaeon CG_4_10_14_0_8_um_filter_47_5]|nr:MAG: cysteine--tRNA ligase [Candidatus Woesearchaeota archaeon CG_4_10_14_0_8_um_filter_47_5]